MTSLIDPTTTESFYTALENAQEDYQDFKETYESLRDFFNAGQIKVFREAHDAVELYMRNQSRIDDGEVKNAAEGMRKILSMAEPYDKIRNLAVLHTTFQEKYRELLDRKSGAGKRLCGGLLWTCSSASEYASLQGALLVLCNRRAGRCAGKDLQHQ